MTRQSDIIPPEPPRWIIREGCSVAMLRRPDYASAMERARYIGFTDPEKVRLIDNGEDWKAIWEAEKALATGQPIKFPA
ncbi:hypothetical protein [Erythrobacter sp. SG61-1L]|uniref:hypothetical protein n=1 Tax=Erythrobacter sp. SG61-1L TaxID=1603897 RepID=UPI000A8648F0|nr:hypothetical protein [Erythrobacter sp. SG61-1L]